jgi:predicted permease
MGPIVTHALEFGLALSVILFGLLLVVLRVNPEIMLNDYPPDIRAKWGPMTERTRRQRALVAGAFLLVILGIVAWSLRSFPAFRAGNVTFAAAFVHFAIMFGTVNTLDWLVLDWGLVYWQPRFLVLPGTEGMAGYGSYWFHFRGFLIGIPIVLLGSALLAAIVSILS